MEDSKIVSLFWERDEKAIEEAASKYGRYCYAIASRIHGNHQDAEESVNNTYYAAWNSIPPNRPALLSAYLGKITRRISLKILRSRNAGKRGGGEVALALDELRECIPAQPNLDEKLDGRKLSVIINAFLSSIPLIERNVFICRYWHLDPVRDICKLFGYSQSKVKSMLHRTRMKLKNQLIEEGMYDEY